MFAKSSAPRPAALGRVGLKVGGLAPGSGLSALGDAPDHVADHTQAQDSCGNGIGAHQRTLA
jgi:hypothetical protein